MKTILFTHKFIFMTLMVLPLVLCSPDDEVLSDQNIEQPDDNSSENPATAVETKDFKFLGASNFGTSGTDEGYAVATDGVTYVFSGSLNSQSRNSVAHIYATDKSFLERWKLRFGEGKINDVILTTDGNFLGVGRLGFNGFDHWTSNGIFVNEAEIFVVKFTPNGSVIWEYKVTASNEDAFGGEAYAVIETSDGNYMITGRTPVNSGIFENSGSFLLKLSVAGELILGKASGISANVYDIIEKDNGDFLISGRAEYSGQDYNAWIGQFSAKGDLINEKNYGSSQYDAALGINQLSNGNYIISGVAGAADGDLSQNKGATDAWIFELDSNLNLVKENTFGSSKSDYARSTYELPSGEILFIGGNSEDDNDVYRNSGYEDFWVVKLSSELKIIDQISFGGFDLDSCQDFIIFPEENQMVLFGYTYSTGPTNLTPQGSSDYYMLRIGY